MKLVSIFLISTARGDYLCNYVSGNTAWKWRCNGIPVLSADAIACKLGYHPSEIWPTWNEESQKDGE